jgi:hypothetical protein
VGVSPDLIWAHAYANLAAVRGVSDARLLRESVALELSSEDLIEAQARARDWQPVAPVAADEAE